MILYSGNQLIYFTHLYQTMQMFTKVMSFISPLPFVE